MPVELACPGCQKMLRAHDGLLGGDALCPFCRSIIKVPKPSAAPAAEPVSDIVPAAAEDLVSADLGVVEPVATIEPTPTPVQERTVQPTIEPVVEPADDDEAPLMPPTFDPQPAAIEPDPVEVIAEPVAPQSAPVSESAADELWWAQTADGQQYGPVPKSELDSWVADGSINAECQVLREGDDQWQWAGQVYPQLT